jgi:hypothetical protein
MPEKSLTIAQRRAKFLRLAGQMFDLLYEPSIVENLEKEESLKPHDNDRVAGLREIDPQSRHSCCKSWKIPRFPWERATS